MWNLPNTATNLPKFVKNQILLVKENYEFSTKNSIGLDSKITSINKAARLIPCVIGAKKA